MAYGLLALRGATVLVSAATIYDAGKRQDPRAKWAQRVAGVALLALEPLLRRGVSQVRREWAFIKDQLFSTTLSGTRTDGTLFHFVLRGKARQITSDIIPADLATLRISGLHHLSDATVVDIVAKAPGLKNLTLHSPGVTGSFLKSVGNQLTTLKLTGPDLTDLADLNRLTQLRKLLLGNRMTQAEITKLTLPTELTHLNLGNVRGSIVDITPLTTTHLERIRFNGGFVESSAARQFNTISTLERLRISNATPGAAATLSDSTTLTRLHIGLFKRKRSDPSQGWEIKPLKPLRDHWADKTL